MRALSYTCICIFALHGPYYLNRVQAFPANRNGRHPVLQEARGHKIPISLVLSVSILLTGVFAGASTFSARNFFSSGFPLPPPAEYDASSSGHPLTIGSGTLVAQQSTPTSLIYLPLQAKHYPGVYLGVYIPVTLDYVSDLSAFQNNTGRKHSIISFYSTWDYPFESVKWIYDGIIANGSIPMVAWGSYPGDTYPLSGILNGDFDDIIQVYAEHLRDYGHTVFMRWGNEMNLVEFPWTGYQNGKDPTKYIAAYRHIHDIYESVGATNVLWVWSPNYASWPGEDWNDYNNYYPGDEYVDWIGVDGYNWGKSSLNSNHEWDSFDSLFADFFGDVSSRYPGKPQMIAEFASVEDDGGSKAAWITDAYSRMIASYPNLRAVVWFNEPVYDPTIPGTVDFRVESSAASRDAYRSVINNPYFRSEAPYQ